MHKIKICYVIVNCKITGPMNQTLNIIKNLDKKLFDISFITLFDEEKNNSMIEEYLKVCKNHYCLHLTKLASLIRGKFVLKNELAKIKPDIIHGLGMPPYRLSLFYKKAKHVITLRNYAYEDYPSYYNKLIGYPLAFLDLRLIKKKLKKGETIVTCSKSLSNIYKEKENIEIPFIRNGIDIEKFKLKNDSEVNKIRKELNLPLNKTILIYTAPFNDRKNQEEVINACLKLKNKNTFLVLCGDGIILDYLKKKYNNEKILFTGKVHNVSEYLRASDIYVSSSKSEGLPNSVLEALSSGLPVVLSNIPQHKELFEIDSKIGFLYNLGDIDEFSNCIDSAIALNYHKKSKFYYEYIKNNLSSVIMAKKYEELYKHIFELMER